MALNEKRVNITTTVPLFIRNSILRGTAYNVNMPISSIRSCLLANAAVDEILENGKTLRLNLSNYNKDNNIVEEVAQVIEEPAVVEEPAPQVAEPTVEVSKEEPVEVKLEEVQVPVEEPKVEEPIKEEDKKSAEDKLLEAIAAEEKEMSTMNFKKKKKH